MTSLKKETRAMASARDLESEIARAGSKMSPTTRKRMKQDYVPYVLEAVKMLTEGNDRGASRQNIEKYLEATLNDETREVRNLSSPVVKSAIRQALNSGLLVHASGIGLNGSFVIPEKSEDLSSVHFHDRKKAVITKEAKPRNISSLASEFQDTPPENTPLKTSNKRQLNTKLVVPFAEVDLVKDDQFEIAEKSAGLKTILKPPKKLKFAGKFKRKSGARRVKFCSPPRVIFITPCIKRKSRRKK